VYDIGLVLRVAQIAESVTWTRDLSGRSFSNNSKYRGVVKNETGQMKEKLVLLKTAMGFAATVRSAD